MRALRIVHVIPDLRSGGAEQVVRDLSKWQAQRGHDVRVVTASPEGSDPAASAQIYTDETVRRVSVGTSLAPAAYARAAWWMWSRRQSMIRADVVHVHLTFGSFVGTVAGLMRDVSRSRTPVIVETDHSAGMPISARQRRAYSLIRHRRDAFVSVIRGTASTTPPNNALYAEIPNGIVPLEIRTSWASHTPFVLGSLGRLSHDRVPERYLDLLDSLRLVRDIHLVFGGDGPYRGRLEAAIAARGLGQCVSLIGMVTDRSEFFRSIDAHVSIAVGDDVGLASLEAASSGTPSFGLQLNSENMSMGSAFPSTSDTDALVELMLPVVDSLDQRRVLGLRQAEYVRSFRSVDGMASAYMDVYQEAMQQARR